MNGKECRVLHAFDCRVKQNQIEGKQPHDLQAFDDETSRWKQQQSAKPNIRSVTLWDKAKEVTASQLLGDQKWVDTLANVFNLSTLMINGVSVSEEDSRMLIC